MSMRVLGPFVLFVGILSGCGGGDPGPSDIPADVADPGSVTAKSSSATTQLSSSQSSGRSQSSTSSTLSVLSSARFSSAAQVSSAASSWAMSMGPASSSVSSPNSVGGEGSSSSAQNVAGDIDRGRTLYDDQCVDCHGGVGEGARFTAINQNCSNTDCDDATLLAAYLVSNMPLGTPAECDEACSADVTAFMLAGYPREGDSTPYTGVAFSCDTDVVPETPAWQRLSKTQYYNALNTVLAELIGHTGIAQAVMNGHWELMDELPDEIRPEVDQDLHGTYRRLNQTVSLSHVEAWFNIGQATANALTETERLAQTVPCFEQMSVAACVEQTINSAGRLILRRPITAEDHAFYSAFYRVENHDGTAYADIFTALFNAPEFLYHTYHGSAASGESTTLAAHELANKLSFHLLDSPPDVTLRAAADDGSLLNDAVYHAQVLRLLADERAQTTTRNFYREWLKLENLNPLHQFNDTENFVAFSEGVLPEWNTHIGFMDEVLDLLDYGTWQQTWGVNDVLTSQLILPNTAHLAEIYGVPQSATPIESPNHSRPGLFTRPAFLANAGINTRPVMKGVFLRHTVLCDDIPAPPDNATDDLPPLDPTLNTRERVEAITERPGTACAFCHEALINGLGFATENYDALGRLRDTERVISGGEVIADVVVDTSTIPKVTNGDFTQTTGAQEVMGLMAESGKVEACVARHYFRYSFGRFEDVQDDACVLESMREGLQQGSLQDLIIHTVESQAFKTRTFVAGGTQ